MSPEHLRGEMAKTERSAGVEPNAGTRVGQSGQNASEVVEFTDERRGSSVAEQLIRNRGAVMSRPSVFPDTSRQVPVLMQIAVFSTLGQSGEVRLSRAQFSRDWAVLQHMIST